MKNLIIAFSLFFAFGANAQAKKATTTKTAVKTEVVKAKLTNAEAAQKNLNDLNAFTPLSTNLQNNLLELFNTKYKMLAEGGTGLSPERKQYIGEIIAHKLEASLDGPTFEKVKNNTALFQSLIN
jgi:hypothetical protein